jgi:uncharacterized protein
MIVRVIPLRALLLATTRSSKRWLIPLGSLLILAGMHSAGTRILLVVGLPILLFGALAHRLPRSISAALAAVAGVVSLLGSFPAHNRLIAAAALLLVAGGFQRAWGINRGRRRRRAWLNRVLTSGATLVTMLFVVYPSALAIDYLAKTRNAVDPSALGLTHRNVVFEASDGIRLNGWYAPGTNGAAVVLVHGGGGDREGTIRHARMLAAAGYGVLLYDARGRGESAGHENAFGWRWDRDVHGAVSFLEAHGVRRIGLLGISTGAEAVVTEASTDRRVRAVVADGLQGRSATDASNLSFGNRISIEPAFAILGAEIHLVRGESPPAPMKELVHTVAATRPLLLIGTVDFERELDRAYVRGTKAQLWQLPKSGHTHGLVDQPLAYRRRALSLFKHALLQPSVRP